MSDQVLIKSIRKSILEITHKFASAHIGSNLSVVEILFSAYSRVSLCGESNCHVILSKGHAALAQYVTMSALNLLPEFNKLEFCQDGSKFFGHTNSAASPLIPLSTGSLGHGLPFGAGLAYAKKIASQKCKTFVIISDGECDEGTTWETALFAQHNVLSELCIIIDRNRIQSFGGTEEVLALEPLGEKWKSFRWEVTEIDGHDLSEIENAISKKTNAPHCIIANTVKGKGISFMENNLAFHYKSPTDAEFKKALDEIS